jgi:coenzyme F420 biosynthesis associated uncharacterized protein
MIDWSAAARVADFVAGTPTAGQRLAGDLDALAAESEQLIVAYTGMQPATALPPPEAVSRPDWIAANLDSMRPLLDPVAGRVGEGFGALAAPLRLVTGLVLAAQVGALTGYLAQRVLGQYDLALLDGDRDPRLLFVAPNLNEAAGKLNADRSELLRWVAFHEVTHAVQFAAVPWLRAHLGGMLRELLDSLEVKVDRPRARQLGWRLELREVVETLRSGDIVTLVLGHERRAVVDRLQATMAVVEGYAEHVMDAVGEDALDSAAELRNALERRRDGRPTLLRVFERLLGLEMKLRQYRDGKRFCDAVVADAGLGTLNRVWGAPEALPSLAELADPTSWIDRTTVPSVTS